MSETSLSLNKRPFMSIARTKSEVREKLGNVSITYLSGLLSEIEDRLVPTGYHKNKRYLTPVQLEIINEYHGGLDD